VLRNRTEINDHTRLLFRAPRNLRIRMAFGFGWG
jgi:hypothetical protein